MPKRQPRRGRLWLTDGACVRHRPTHRHHGWAYDGLAMRTQAGRPVTLLPLGEEYIRAWLALEVARPLRADDVLARLADLVVHRGAPEAMRSDNGPELTARAVRQWRSRVGVRTLSIAPGRPWENGSIERCTGQLRDELLTGERFSTLWEAPVVIARWRQADHQVRPHRALGDRPPAPAAIAPQPLWA